MKKPVENGLTDNKPVTLDIDGVERVFDIDDPELPDWIDKRKLSSGGHPYPEKMAGKDYDKDYERLQVELVRLQYWLQQNRQRVMILFEGRDAAGKGGTIGAMHEFLNPRTARNVALLKPTEREAGQWYFQRYVAHFPSAGELVSFDRSWYNRAGVEPVMGFCTPEQHVRFLTDAPQFERAIVNEGIHFFKVWLDIGRETQLKRFHDRRHSPLKSWKFSPIDVQGISRWDDYTKMRDLMFERTDTDFAPWTVVRADDKRRARLAVMRRILLSIDFEGRDLDAIGKEDKKIIGGPRVIG